MLSFFPGLMIVHQYDFVLVANTWTAAEKNSALSVNCDVGRKRVELTQPHRQNPAKAVTFSTNHQWARVEAALR